MILIPTERPGLWLRQFVSEDAEALYVLIDRNRDHLSQHLDDTAAKYPTYELVLQSITNPPESNKLRFGVWDEDVLVGSVNIKFQGNIAEVGYWVGSEFTRSGYATVAAKALCAWAKMEYKNTRLCAFVHKDNLTSQRVLERCGFESQGFTITRELKRSETALLFRQKPKLVV